MATAKLWWNGSSWVTSEADWVNETKDGNYQLGIHLYARIIAYDNATIHLIAWANGYQTASIYANYGVDYNSVAFRSGTTEGSGTSIGTGSVDADITSYLSVNYKGNAQAFGTQNYQTSKSGAISFNGHTTYSTPFYTVSYNVNGGSGSISSTTGVKQYSVTLTSSKPTRTGYTFAGWNTKSDGTGTTYSSSGTLPARSSDITLYAKWTVNNYNVSISAGEGTTITFDGTSYTNTTTTVSKPYGKSCSYTITANTGWIIKTASPATSGTITIPANNNTALSSTGQRVGCKIYNGSSWKQGLIYVYNGSQWKLCQAYVWDGNSWELLN